MAAKRLRNDSDEQGSDQPEDKRMRGPPSFATVIREALMAKYLQNFGLALEPLIRRVVQEEVERGLVRGARYLQRSPQIQIEAAELSSFQLIFRKPPSRPIFTGSKIEDEENKPLELLLVDTRNGGRSIVTAPSPLKIEIVAIDGDFTPDDQDNWKSADFNKSIVKERTGRRPLLTGDVLLTLRDGTVSIGDLMFTDNSSWLRSRHFMIGARIAPGSYDGPRIKEALTEPFMVKDHRGELYRKHYPPALGDEVWRLEKIGKDGVFHKKLSAEGINTVQDFLKLWFVYPDQLRRILGVGMSDRIWEVTINHAKSCTIGEKLYLYRGSHCSILLTPICEVLGVVINGMTYAVNDLSRSERMQVQQLVSDAYRNWNTLEETDGLFSGNNALLQNEMVSHIANASLPLCPHQQESTIVQFGGLDEAGVAPNNNLQLGFSSSAAPNTTGLPSMVQWS